MAFKYLSKSILSQPRSVNAQISPNKSLIQKKKELKLESKEREMIGLMMNT